MSDPSDIPDEYDPKHILVLSGFDAIRRRLSMFVGDTGGRLGPAQHGP